MASCYGSISAPSTRTADGLQCLPIRTVLPDGTRVEIDYFRESEHEAGQDLLNGVIEEGLSWPFEEALDMAAFRAYFLSHAAFVVRAISSPPPADTPTPTTGTPPCSGKGHGEARSEETDDAKGGRSSSGGGGGDRTGALQQAEQAEQVAVWGVFYIKPNFPGRCSHVCNGGFITDPRRRRRGVARLMGHAFLRLARELGYKASYFNLVFRNNEASLRLWRGLGFTELAVVPEAGRLKGIDGLVDAIQFYYNLELLRERDLPEDLRGSTGVAEA